MLATGWRCHLLFLLFSRDYNLQLRRSESSFKMTQFRRWYGRLITLRLFAEPSAKPIVQLENEVISISHY